MHVCIHIYIYIYIYIAGLTYLCLFNMVSNYVRILCGEQLYRYVLVQTMITQLLTKRRSFWWVPCIRNSEGSLGPTFI